MRASVRSAIVGLSLAAFAVPARAQFAEPAPHVRAPRSAAPQAGALEVWGGISHASPQLGILGEAPDMRFGVVALRWSRSLGAPPPAHELPKLEWTVDFVPYARISPSLVSLRGTGYSCLTAELCVLRPPSLNGAGAFPPGSPIGFGIAPIGLTRRFLRGARFSPFVGVTSGFLLFDRDVPTTKATRFNFTASAEAGVRLGPPGESGITLSYRFHHLSNAGTAGENPGLASHVIALGIHRPRWSR